MFKEHKDDIRNLSVPTLSTPRKKTHKSSGYCYKS
jgi:hypothetical protein